MSDSTINVPPAPASAELASTPAAAKGGARNSYGQILKSSALVGGSKIVDVLVGMVRVKVMAVLLGPAGFGLMGFFTSIADLTRSVAGMGVNTSGVRQIAEAVGSGDQEQIARTVTVLRRTSLVLGALGGLFLIVFCRQVSQFTFQTEAYALPVALLSVAVLIRTASDGQGAVIQGTRRIADLAKCAVFGSLLGTGLTIPLLFFFREQGVVPSLIAVAAMSFCLTWWFSRKAGIRPVVMTAEQVTGEVKSLLRLGLAFMASGLLMLGSMYAIRLIVLRHYGQPTEGLEAAGFYGAAWAMGGLYIGTILEAMGADFYPRLTGLASNDAECNRAVNEQAEISLLLAGPGVLFTMTMAPLVLTVFYSPKFEVAVTLLRWICLGMMLRVISWPMGFIVLAKGRQRPFFWSEVAWAAVHIALAWVCIGWFGLNGAGIAFFGSYLFHIFLIYFIARKASGFRWAAANWRIGMVFLPVIGLIFISFQYLPFWVATGLGLAASVLSGVFSLRTLVRLVPLERLPRMVQTVLRVLRFAPSSPR